VVTPLRRRLALTALVGALAVSAVTPAGAATRPLPPENQPQVTISGIGATFPAPIYSEWFSQFAGDFPKAAVKFDYAAQGSGAGINAVKAGTADYGASDAAMTNAEMAAASVNGGVIHVPTVLGVVVLAYNVPGIKITKTGRATTLKLTPGIVAKIYAGQIPYWNDASIKAVNAGVTIPHTRITPVRRSDSSGTTFVFQSYLYKVSSTWRCILGAARAVKTFPTGPQACLGGKSLPGVGVPRNSGVAARVGKTKGAIGYMEYAYAATGGLKMARLKNAKGVYVTPSTSGASAAAAASIGSLPADLRAAPIVNATGYASWPIVSYTYILAYKNEDFTTQDEAKMWVAYLYWALTTGQQYARSLGYAPLPSSVKTKAIAKLHQITFGGSAVWP
jgi:phosphate transport system substrate-binding protein